MLSLVHSHVTLNTPAIKTDAIIFAGIASLGVMWFLRKIRGFIPAFLALIGAVAILLALAGHKL